MKTLYLTGPVKLFLNYFSTGVGRISRLNPLAINERRREA
jgi:hypothetical protein